jgi:hypothetical protein
MTKAGHDGIAVDMLPMVSATADGLLAPVLPGSGTKGALRSQAERIVRTLLDISLPDETVRGRNRHLEQLKVPLVENLFGTAKSADTESQDGKPDRWQPGRGVLSVATTFAEGARAAAGHWRAIADAAPDPDQGVPDPAERPLCKALADAGLGADSSAGSAVPRLEQAFHVAVDRWTGGAAEKLLFSGIEPFAIPWAPIELTLETGRLPPGLREPALALLLLVLRDLSEGRVTLGVGANRGYGSLVVERLELAVAKGRDEAGSLAWLDGLVLDAPLDLTALDAARMGEVQQAWHTWIIDQGGRHD